MTLGSRSQWPRGLRRRSTAARMLQSYVRIPLGTWMFVCCECCVLSGRILCDGLITRPERSPTDCGASLCVIKKPRTRGGYSPARGLQNTNPQWVVAPVEKKMTLGKPGVSAEIVWTGSYQRHNVKPPYFNIF